MLRWLRRRRDTRRPRKLRLTDDVERRYRTQTTPQRRMAHRREALVTTYHIGAPQAAGSKQYKILSGVYPTLTYMPRKSARTRRAHTPTTRLIVAVLCCLAILPYAL